MKVEAQNDSWLEPLLTMWGDKIKLKYMKLIKTIIQNHCVKSPKIKFFVGIKTNHRHYFIKPVPDSWSNTISKEI